MVLSRGDVRCRSLSRNKLLRHGHLRRPGLPLEHGYPLVELTDLLLSLWIRWKRAEVLQLLLHVLHLSLRVHPLRRRIVTSSGRSLSETLLNLQRSLRRHRRLLLLLLACHERRNMALSEDSG